MFLVLNSKNTKVGNIAITYLPIKQTCPKSCPLKDNGCYAKNSFVGFTVSRLENKFKDYHGFDIIRKEAREIINNAHLSNGKTLRLHGSGDVRTAKGANLLAKAAEKWKGKVYTYTHSWRDISRKSWGNISVLASVESLADAKLALKNNYAPAMLVENHPENGKAYIKDNLKIIPCPSQTRGITCEQCNLCMNDSMLKNQNAVIAFAAHGVAKKRALKVIK